jgi:hypothetical protein
VTDLNPAQFSAHRGLILGTGRAPASDDEVLSQIRPRPSYANPQNIYGDSWSTRPEVAKNFATNPNAGGYETMPSRMRKYSRAQNTEGHWGVVLDAQKGTEGHDMSIPYSEHEKETRVRDDDVHSVTAHVLEHRPYKGRREEGLMPREHFERNKTPIRSVEVPPEHWSTYSAMVKPLWNMNDREFTETPTGRRWVRTVK